jgi:hypothetical protein
VISGAEHYPFLVLNHGVEVMGNLGNSGRQRLAFKCRPYLHSQMHAMSRRTESGRSPNTA